MYLQLVPCLGARIGPPTKLCRSKQDQRPVMMIVTETHIFQMIMCLFLTTIKIRK